MVGIKQEMDSRRSMRKRRRQAVNVRKGVEKKVDIYNSLFQGRGARCYVALHARPRSRHEEAENLHRTEFNTFAPIVVSPAAKLRRLQPRA